MELAKRIFFGTIGVSVLIFGCSSSEKSLVEKFCELDVGCSGDTILLLDTETNTVSVEADRYDFCIDSRTESVKRSSEYRDALNCIIDCAETNGCAQWDNCSAVCYTKYEI